MPAADAESQQQAAQLARDAEAHFGRGRTDIAELYAMAAAELDPDCAAAWKLLAQLALSARRPERAAAWLRRALESRPQDRQAADLLREAEAQAPFSTSSPRYLLVREWSQGFWSDVDHVLCMCLLAEITGRIPLVWWGSRSRFRPRGGGNAWTRFFAPVSSASMQDLEDRQPRVFPGKWRDRNLASTIANRWAGDGSRVVGLHFLGREEDVLVSDFHTSLKALLPWLPPAHPLAGKPLVDAYRDLVRRYLRPQPDIVVRADRFAGEQFGGGPVLGVHARGSDKIEEVSELANLLAAYFPLVDERLRAAPTTRLFLLTDDTRIRIAYEARFGSRLISTDCSRTDSGQAVHYKQHDDPSTIGTEVMVDALLATRCDAFIGLGYSNVSLYVSYLKAWPPGSCVLLGDNLHEAWNALVLEMPAPPHAE
jgi:protein O-GlcNAc transferase